MSDGNLCPFQIDICQIGIYVHLLGGYLVEMQKFGEDLRPYAGHAVFFRNIGLAFGDGKNQINPALY